MARNSKVIVSSDQLKVAVTGSLNDIFRKKLHILRTFNLRKSLKCINPYLMMINGRENVSQIVENSMKMHLCNSKETIFKDTLFDPMLGHAYGRAKSQPTKDTIYRRSSGQAFWEEITGDPNFYIKLVTLMKDEPAKHILRRGMPL
jgi:hypothetical protein